MIVKTPVGAKVNIGDMQFGFMQGCGTSDAIVLVSQLQENYLGKEKKLVFAQGTTGCSMQQLPYSNF